ncbi:DUF2231 domain-containing protein [Modestobacter sp. Leaf380]|uniref:DUF2231 domain-containing protein n=1 Tax=Modestobacter sp. Leaf380 TaxID=1736356 RepID=UPI0006F6ACD4|nr:DUF2231 domain-containing protein [Modestobacter sp. Leaf380]KQS66536.1 hypothetical protein ASG41_08540 [Modestobacter sp. Leaf380]
MPETLFGLPAHPLIVHATVVLVPLGALLVLLHALWPAARRRLGIVTPLVALVGLVLTPLSTASGEDLERMVGRSSLIEAHSELADGLLPWMVALFVMAVVVHLLGRRPAGARRVVGLVAAVLAVIAVVGVTQQVVRIGHSGAEATWSDVSSGGTADGD